MDPSVPAAYGLSRLGLLALPALVSLHATALNTNLYAAYTLSAGFGMISHDAPNRRLLSNAGFVSMISPVG